MSREGRCTQIRSLGIKYFLIRPEATSKELGNTLPPLYLLYSILSFILSSPRCNRVPLISPISQFKAFASLTSVQQFFHALFYSTWWNLRFTQPSTTLTFQLSRTLISTAIMVEIVKDLYPYSPDTTASIVAAALFGTSAILHLYQMIRKRTWFYTSMTIGAFSSFPLFHNSWPHPLLHFC